MTLALKATIAAASLVAALTLVWLLAEQMSPRDLESHPAVREPQATQLDAPVRTDSPSSVMPAYWVFAVTAIAADDPQEGRAVQTAIRFEGSTGACPAEALRSSNALSVSRDEKAARVGLKRELCVPACGTEPPAAGLVGMSLRNVTATSAYQDEFDRAPDSFSPGGRMSAWQWSCNGVSQAVLSAAHVSLACSTDECDEEQAVNASAFIGFDAQVHGKFRVLLPLQATHPGTVLGVVEGP